MIDEAKMGEGQQKFINRIKTNIFDELGSKMRGKSLNDLLKAISNKLGINPPVFRNMVTGELIISNGIIGLVNNDFHTLKKALQVLSTFTFHVDGFNLEKSINSCIDETLDIDDIDLGIRFVNGKFIEKDAIVIDERVSERVHYNFKTSVLEYNSKKVSFSQGKGQRDLVKRLYDNLNSWVSEDDVGEKGQQTLKDISTKMKQYSGGGFTSLEIKQLFQTFEDNKKRYFIMIG